MKVEINELVKEAHENAVEKGWWDKEPTFGELIALCHSELSEALEEYRTNVPETKLSRPQMSIYYRGGGCVSSVQPYMKDRKPEGIPIELADVVIRIADLCGHYGINLEQAIKEKMEYNKTRSYRHGGKVI